MEDNLERLIPTSRPADRASLREPGIRPPTIPQAGYFPPLLGRELRRNELRLVTVYASSAPTVLSPYDERLPTARII
jgi:hypothetical protein